MPLIPFSVLAPTLLKPLWPVYPNWLFPKNVFDCGLNALKPLFWVVAAVPNVLCVFTVGELFPGVGAYVWRSVEVCCVIRCGIFK